VPTATLANILWETQYFGISQPGAVNEKHPLFMCVNQLDEQFLCRSSQTVLASFQIKSINSTLPSLQAAQHPLAYREGFTLNERMCLGGLLSAVLCLELV
jgi:hypothetical protein